MEYGVISLNLSEMYSTDNRTYVIKYNIDRLPPVRLKVTPDRADDVTTTVPALSFGYGLAESIVIIIILTSFIIFALAGNVLVIVAILTDRRLRRTSNFFIISLAVADALVALLVMTFSVVNEVCGRWIFGRAFCDIWISSDVMCSTASIMNLCAISLDRYIHIRNPFQYDQWVTKNRTLLAIAGVWILSALISFLPIHLDWHRLDTYDVIGRELTTVSGRNVAQIAASSRVIEHKFLDDDDLFICMLDLNPLYAVISSSVSFFLPCIMMISIYIKLYRYARGHVKSIRKTQVTFQPPNSSAVTSRDTDAASRTSDHKAAVTLGIIMGVFLICWAPFFTANIIGAYCPSCVPPVAFSAFTWLGYINSTMNPVIYSIFNQEFCQAFKRVLMTGRRCSRSGQSDGDLPSTAEMFRRNERSPQNGTYEVYELPARENVKLVRSDLGLPTYL